MGKLYIVATPIGNLQDITLRALEILKQVDVVAAEDTRETMKLLSAFDIRKRLISCRSANEANSAKGIIQILEGGQSVAYCSDAGTPGLSDPGAVLVGAVRLAGYEVVPIPGVSALATIVSVGGFGGRTVTFDGFLSVKPGKRRKRLRELLDRNEAFVVYESPFRIVKLLQDISDIDKTREVLVGREMTKSFEEFVQGSAETVLQDFQSRTIIKGEFAVLVSGTKLGDEEE